MQPVPSSLLGISFSAIHLNSEVANLLKTVVLSVKVGKVNVNG